MLTYTDTKNNTAITYGIISTPIEPTHGVSEVYGVEAEMTINGTVTSRASVSDVFCLKSDAEKLLKLLAENGAEPCHIVDIIQDLL
ncbi:MAG: DUF6514 family protein [Clostridia bacterium]